MGDVGFVIDPDIRVAKTLPGRVYSDPMLFAAQRERVFARTWHYAAHDEVVKVAGQVYPFTLLPGALDEPLLLTRDAQDRLHALSNVCTHRGTLVADGPGHEQQLRCRYHGRRFTLDGRFHSMPEFEETADFPSAADDLPRVALGTWQRFFMVALAPAMTFDDVVAPLRARLGHLPFDELVLDTTGARDYVVNANWALYIDNYLEGFHIPYVHNSLAAGRQLPRGLPHPVRAQQPRCGDRLRRIRGRARAVRGLSAGDREIGRDRVRPTPFARRRR